MLSKKLAHAATAALLLTFIPGCGADPSLLSQPRVGIHAMATAPQPVLPKIHLRIKQAEIEITANELNKQFKSILELSEEKRLRNVTLTPAEGSGILAQGHLVIPIIKEVPFTMEGTLSVKPGQIIHFEADKIKVAGLSVKKLMDLIGLELANLAKFKDRFGRIVQAGNGFDLVVEKFTDDAVIEGQMKQIRTNPQGITVFF